MHTRHHTHDGRPTPSSGPPSFTGTTDRCYIASKSLFEQKGIILRLVHRPAFIEGDLERNFGSKCLPGLLHHHFMFFHVSNYTNQSASLESASCLRRKRDYVVAPHPQADRPTCRATSAGGQTNLSRHIRRRTDQPFTTGHASSTTKRGALKWLTQEADAKNWSSPKHVQPEEGRKEPAPRAIRFRKSRVETTI